MTFANEQGFTQLVTEGTMFRGWALSEQGQEEEGMAQIRQGLAAQPAQETACVRPHFLALLAEACGKQRQEQKGCIADEALTAIDRNVGRFYEAELYRLKGKLLLLNTERGMMNDERKIQEVEACFHKAIEVARQQQARSLELRAATSLARLWQQQGKTVEARDLLAPIYNWFTEGFDTKIYRRRKPCWTSYTKIGMHYHTGGQSVRLFDQRQSCDCWHCETQYYKSWPGAGQ